MKMKTWTRLLVLLTLAVFVPALAAACGGGGSKKDDDGEAKPTRTAAANDDETPEKAASPTKRAAVKTKTPAAKATVSARPTTAPSVFDLASFHYAVEISFNVVGETEGIGGSIEGDFVAPNSHSYSQQFAFGGLSGSEDAIIIGDRAWQREGEGDWDEVDPDTLNTDLTSADPEFIADSEFIEDIDVLDSEDDEVDGREARKFSFSLDDIETIAGLLGEDFLDSNDLEDVEGFTMLVWVDKEEDIILRADLTATALAAALGDTGLGVDPDQVIEVRLTLRLSRVNDDSIEIEPPV